jgi:Immunoglobulin I-set domain
VTQPQPVSLYQGQGAATFSVTAVGAAPLGYQWFTNGIVALSDNANRMGSTSNVLTIPNPTVADNGIYTVVVTNNYGSVTSAPVALTVSLPGQTTITLHDAPVGITNTLASTSINLPFTVTSGANVLVVILLDKSSSTAGVAPTTLSWNGMTLAQAITTVDSGSIYRDASVYYVYNPAVGSANITGTLTATPVCSYLQAYTLSGVDTYAAPATGAANSVSGTSLTFTATAAANSWAAVGGVLGAYGVAGVAVTGTGGDASGVFYGNDTSADNCAFAFGYLSGLSGGTDTIAYSWNLAGRTPTANAFVGAIFAPQPSSPLITSVSLNAATLAISATNGTPGGAWILLQSANLALPLSQWQTNSTGNFDSSGNLSTNIVNTATNGQEFYILKVQ